MRDELIRILYGNLYDASPGSDRYTEQCRRIQEAIAAVFASEEEMPKKNPPKRPTDENRPKDQKEKPESFRKSIIKKFSDGPEGEVDGV